MKLLGGYTSVEVLLIAGVEVFMYLEGHSEYDAITFRPVPDTDILEVAISSTEATSGDWEVIGEFCLYSWQEGQKGVMDYVKEVISYTTEIEVVS